MSYVVYLLPEWATYLGWGLVGVVGSCAAASFYLWLSERKEKRSGLHPEGDEKIYHRL